MTGEYGSLLSNYWIYDPATDLWEVEDLTAFEGSVRKNAVAFSTGTRGFVVTGQASSSYYDDTWELSPYEYEEEYKSHFAFYRIGCHLVVRNVVAYLLCLEKKSLLSGSDKT